MDVTQRQGGCCKAESNLYVGYTKLHGCGGNANQGQVCSGSGALSRGQRWHTKTRRRIYVDTLKRSPAAEQSHRQATRRPGPPFFLSDGGRQTWMRFLWIGIWPPHNASEQVVTSVGDCQGTRTWTRLLR